MRNQSGWSFLETLFALVIIGTACLALAEVMRTASARSTANAQNEAALHLIDKLSESMSDDDSYCDHMLKGLAFNASNPSGTAVPQLSYHDLDGASGPVSVRVGDAIGQTGLILRELTLRPEYSVDANTVVASLQVTLSRTNALASQWSRYSLPVYAIVAAGTIKNCSLNATNQITLKQRMCEIKSDGWAFYDPVAETCKDDPRVVIQTGTPTILSCSAGFKLAGDADDPIGSGYPCGVDTSDTVVSSTRTYSDGSTSPTNYILYKGYADYLSNSCIFATRAGADPSAAKGTIKCVPFDAVPL